jgi:hypothetical protein
MTSPLSSDKFTFSPSGLSQDRLNLRNGRLVIAQFIDNLVDQVCKQFAFCATGFADGHQRSPSPLLRTVLMQRAQQQTVRCADEIDVADLPLARAHLTIFQAQLLLAVPRKRLGACPAMAIRQQHMDYLPQYAIAHQRLTGLRVTTLSQKQHDVYCLIHCRYVHTF